MKDKDELERSARNMRESLGTTRLQVGYPGGWLLQKKKKTLVNKTRDPMPFLGLVLLAHHHVDRILAQNGNHESVDRISHFNKMRCLTLMA
jgi:hypothetical protein